MGFNDFQCFPDGIRRVLESFQPLIYIHIRVLYPLQVFIGHAAQKHFLNHRFGINVLHPAIIVANNHDLFYAKLINANEQTAHDASKGMLDDASRIFNDFRVSVFNV